MEALVLAGGFGTRLSTVVAGVPKPMAPVHGKPFLHYLAAYLSRNNVSRIVFCTGYLHESIERYFGNRYLGMDIGYSVEREPLGTGGAFVKALPLVSGDCCLLLNGDSFFNVPVADLLDAHRRHKADLTIALVNRSVAGRYGSVRLEGDRIAGFDEKTGNGPRLVNAGIYAVQKSIVDAIALPKAFSLEKDLLEKYCGRLTVTAFKGDGYFIDIGVPEDYRRAQREYQHLETA
jgi:D-glycero-alpha-D-manno-heptose 1-phosphate guanylyltransferase